MGCRCALSFPDRSQLRRVCSDTPSTSAASRICRNSLEVKSLVIVVKPYQGLVENHKHVSMQQDDRLVLAIFNPR